MQDCITKEERMSSVEIANITGKEHKNVMQSIRAMEPAWEKVGGLKFQLSSYKTSQNKMVPCYSLTKTECLYIATKFNDEARAKLVLRWEELNHGYNTRIAAFFSIKDSYGNFFSKKIG